MYRFLHEDELDVLVGAKPVDSLAVDHAPPSEGDKKKQIKFDFRNASHRWLFFTCPRLKIDYDQTDPVFYDSTGLFEKNPSMGLVGSGPLPTNPIEEEWSLRTLCVDCGKANEFRTHFDCWADSEDLFEVRYCKNAVPDDGRLVGTEGVKSSLIHSRMTMDKARMAIWNANQEKMEGPVNLLLRFMCKQTMVKYKDDTGLAYRDYDLLLGGRNRFKQSAGISAGDLQ